MVMDHIIVPLPENAGHATQANLLSAIREFHPHLALANLLTQPLVAWFDTQVEQGHNPDIFDAYMMERKMSSEDDALIAEYRRKADALERCYNSELSAVKELTESNQAFEDQCNKLQRKLEASEAARDETAAAFEHQNQTINHLEAQITLLKAKLWDMSQMLENAGAA